MRALILSCNTGQGHNTAGRAVLEALERMDIPCEMRDTLSFSSEMTSDLISGTYMKMAANMPWLFHSIYTAGNLISSPRIKSPVYFANTTYANDLRDYIACNQIDTVVCSHLFPAEALTYIKRNSGLRARCYAIATDYTCVPFWEETDMEAFFVPHKTLMDEFHQKGIPFQKLVPTGIPVSARFNGKTTRSDARSALGLDLNERIVLVMTGSMGYGHTVPLIRQLLPCGAKILVMVGRNQSLQKAIEEAFPGVDEVVALPYTDNVPLYMDACDVLLTKPGGLSSTEAAVKNVALVHTEPIPGCETCNARFFVRNGLSKLTDTPAEAATAAMALMLNEPAREQMLTRQRAVIAPHAADDIVQYMLEASNPR